VEERHVAVRAASAAGAIVRRRIFNTGFPAHDSEARFLRLVVAQLCDVLWLGRAVVVGERAGIRRVGEETIVVKAQSRRGAFR